MSNSQDKPEAEKQHACPLCGGDIDFESPIVQATRRRIRFVAAMIPLGVILAVGGRLLAAFTTLDSWGYGLMGFGIAVALFSALYVKSLD